MMIPVLLGLVTVVFALFFILPGDPARLRAGPSASPEVIENIRREMGLDRPLGAQYLDFLAKLAKGDLGRSYQSNRPVIDELSEVVPRTFQLAIFGELISCVLGAGLGLVAAAFQNRWPDRLVTTLAAFQLSFPAFWLALMLQILICVKLGWLPPSGYESGFDKYIILPAVTLAIPSAGILARLTRTTVIEVMSEDYIRTARGKGLNEWLVLYRYAFRNALIPLVTTVGLDFTRLLGGILIIEVIFCWPGLGKYAYDALVYKDLPALQASVIVFAISVTLVNLLVDISYRLLDPRIRYAD